MIRERFQKVRIELVAIDDNLYRAVCLFEGDNEAPQNVRDAVSALGNAVRGVICLLLRTIDSLP